MDCSPPGFPVFRYLPEFAQTHLHRVGDAIQPSNPLSSSSPLAFKLSQHQGLFKWVSSSHQMAKVFGASASVLSMNIQDWFPLELTGLISLQSTRLSRVLSNTTVLCMEVKYAGWQYTALTYFPNFEPVHLSISL